jgi:hypothetical protein
VNNSLHDQIRRYLGNERVSYCDSCLALQLRESLQDMRTAALTVARGDGYSRRVETCYTCNRTIEMTVAMGSTIMRRPA